MSDSETETTDESESSTDPKKEVSTLLPGFIARSFLTKFILTLLLVLLVVGGVSAFTFVQTSDQLTDEVETEYVGAANQSAQQVENWREARADTTRRLSQFGVIQSGSQSEVQNFLENETDNLPDDVINVHYVDKGGLGADILASSNPANAGNSLRSREAPWQNDELNYTDGVFTSDAESALSTSLVSFVSPIDRPGPQEDSEMILVVQTDFDSVASSLSTQDNQFTQVVDREGRVVADTTQAVNLEQNAGSLPNYLADGDASSFIDRALVTSGFTEDALINQQENTSYAAAWHPVSNADWAVITHVESSAAFQLRSTILQSLGILAGAVVLGFVFIALVFGRGTVRTLRRLTSKAEELGSGNLDVDLPVKRADEFGTLTASFAAMRDSLRERIQEADEARREAEKARVQAVEMNTYLQEKAEEYGQIMQQCATGDMTQRMETDGENEAMDQIAEEFNEMVAELEKTTGQLQTFSDEVINSSDFVLTSAESVRKASEQVADSAQRISDDAHNQRDRLEDIARDLDDVVTTFEEIAAQNPELDIQKELDQFREFQTELEAAVETSEGLLPETESVAGAAQEQAAELNEVTSTADRLKRYAQPLGDIVNKFETDEEHEFVFSTGPTNTPDDD